MNIITSEDTLGFEYNHWLSRGMIAFLVELAKQHDFGLPNIESIRKVKISNFMITPGRVMCRAQNGNGALVKVEIILKEFDFQTWAKIISAAALNAYLVSKLYLGELPAEMEGVFINHNASIMPLDASGISILQDGKELEKLNYYGVAAIEKLASRFEEDPFAVFLLRGYDKDEFISELRKFRSNLQKLHAAKFKESAAMYYEGKSAEADERENTGKKIAEFLEQTNEISNYWKCGEDISKLKFSIKADDLPASILKWLDPLPLGGLENKVNYQLEEIYAHVAKRAHSFGLGL